jgi:hypothetical protein
VRDCVSLGQLKSRLSTDCGQTSYLCSMADPGVNDGTFYMTGKGDDDVNTHTAAPTLPASQKQRTRGSKSWQPAAHQLGPRPDDRSLIKCDALAQLPPPMQCAGQAGQALEVWAQPTNAILLRAYG